MKRLHIYWADRTPRPLHTVSTQGGAPSLPPNVKVRRKRETHAVESGGVLGISREEDFNIVGLLICDVDNFTIRFCRAAWHRGSVACVMRMITPTGLGRVRRPHAVESAFQAHPECNGTQG